MATCTHLRWSAAILFSGLLGCSSGSTNNTPTCQVAGQAVCSTPVGLQCFDTQNDAQHCGAACSPCQVGQTCTAGVCVTGGMSCGAPNLMCGATCANPLTDSLNCGACGNICTGGKTCQAGACQCAAGSMDCTGAGVCSPLASDPLHCGNCATACTATAPLCSAGTCSSSCSAGLSQCGSSCVNVLSDLTNCGTCGNACPANNSCTNGVCVPPVVIGVGGATSIGVGGATSIIGQGGATSVIGQGGATSVIGQGGSTTAKGGATGAGGATTAKGGATGAGGATSTGTRVCAAAPTAISDFEEGAGAPKVLSATGVTGAWEAFHNTATDGAVGTQTMAVEALPAADATDCNKFALHTTGSGWGGPPTNSGTTWTEKGWVGIGLTNMAGTATATPQTAYNATTKSYTGIKFRAKKGAGSMGNSPVRFNLSTLQTEGTGSGGSCTTNCYNHLGRFLHQENVLTTSWSTYTFCFDRDLHPLFLPTGLTNAQRDAAGQNLLKIQFQFNKGKDISKESTSTGIPPYPTTDAFDFWVDDIEFVSTCPKADYASDAGAAKKFPTNAALGGSATCAPATGAANFSTPISQAYARWKTNFVVASGSNLKVIAPEQAGATTSEAMGYGLMIAAAMGDKTTFDKFLGYVNANLVNGLMDWIQGGSEGSNSASDGDEDIAYGLLMANAQWPSGGYKTAADAMINAIATQDLVGSRLKPGNQWDPGFYNPSYFAPAAYRSFVGTNAAFSGVITDGYARITSNVNETTAGYPTDWCTVSGTSTSCAASMPPGGTAVTGGFTVPVFGYDGARVPWRIGMDVCKASTGGGDAILGTMVTAIAAKYTTGIDNMDAGIVKSTGLAATGAAKMQASFIGSIGVAAMAKGNAAVRDRAFRTVLDILENPQFNRTYFPSTVGMLTLLAMGGDFPMP